MPNLDLKYITDENGNRVLPITHVNAVRDSSGNTLSSLMAPEKNGNGIGTCSTSSGTALIVSLTGYELVTNGFVAVTFTNDVPASATLNINGKGANPIYYKGSAIEADVIKADDTVMFAYDGTNYVVTSLGGGGAAPVVPQEYALIHLTSTEGDGDTNLIGATITITDDDTSDVIASTTWSGSDYTVMIDRGINYTVTVGNVTDYIIRLNTQSYTAVGNSVRNISFLYIGGYVDLDLTSGTLWSSKNLFSYTPEGTGLFFSWGNIQGYDPNGTHSFDATNYSGTKGNTIAAGASFTSGDATYDAAAYHTNGVARTPTLAEWQELMNGTNRVVETINGVACYKFSSKSDSSKYIYLPAKGMKIDSNVEYTDRAIYWSCTGASGDNPKTAYDTNFITSATYFQIGTDARACGEPVRPVI